ncbi:MAG: O-antigen ligase family protein [Deltaproteobacteria bacterium]|nr:O-antigen ligase family protein [Deltaproteobacteria bacterium]MCL5278105.1 O-antigen ligase family protein [Deltaproteobacteria bacterium]
MDDKNILIRHSETIASGLDYLSTASLMLLLFLVPLAFYKSEYIWSKVFVIYLLLWPVIIVYFLRSLLYHNIDFFYTPVLIPLVLLDAVAGLSVFHAYNAHLSLQTLIQQIAYQAPFFLFIYYAKDIKLKTAATIVAIASIVVSTYGLIQFFHIVTPPLDQWGRPNPASTMGLTNFTTDYLVMASPLILTLFLTSPDRSVQKYTAYSGLLLTVAYIIVGKNRAGWVALAGSMLFYAIMVGTYARHRLLTVLTKRLILYTGIAGAVLLAGTMGFTRTGRGLVQRAESIFNSGYSSNAFRLLVWDSTLRGVREEPVFGVGIGNYQINIPLYEVKALKTTDWIEERYLDNAHNEYLQMLFELGIAGTVFFVWFIFEIFFTSLQSIKDAQDDIRNILWNITLMTGIVSALITALFTFNFEIPSSALMFWVFAGLIVGKRKYRYFEDEYGFVSILKKLSGFKWRWKYDFGLSTSKNYPLILFLVASFIVGTVLLGNLTFFSYRQAAADIYNMEAETYLDLKMPQKAKDTADRAYKLVPDDYIVLYTLARAKAGSLDTADAIVDAKRVISLAPYFSYAHKLLGFLYYSKDNYAGAINEFKTSIELMPLSIHEVGPYLISSYLSTNDIASGIALAARMKNEEPRNEIYDFFLGTAYSMEAKYNSAIQYLKEAVSDNPSDFKAVLNLTECLQKTGDYSDALTYAVQLTKIASNNPLAWYTLAHVYTLMHNDKGAFAALAKLFTIDPSFKMTVVNNVDFSRLLGKSRMKELLTGKVFVMPQSRGRRR